MINIKLSELQKERAVLAGAGVLFLIVGWLLAVQPQLGKIRLFKEGAGTARERAELITEIQSLQAKIRGLETLFPNEAERHEVLGKVSALANESGFSLDSLVPTSEPGEPYSRLNLALRTETSFPLLFQFLDKVENMKPVVSISHLIVTNRFGGRAGRSESSVPQVDMTLETYLKKK